MGRTRAPGYPHHLRRRLGSGAGPLARDQKRLPNRKGKEGFVGKQRSYVNSHPTHQWLAYRSSSVCVQGAPRDGARVLPLLYLHGLSRAAFDPRLTELPGTSRGDDSRG